MIKAMQNPGEWPLDTIVEIGTFFGGPSQNDASNPAHINFQNMSNSSKKIEDEIRILCSKTFDKYLWKIKKVWFDTKISKKYDFCKKLFFYVKLFIKSQ